MTRDRYGSADVPEFKNVAMPVVGDGEVLGVGAGCGMVVVTLVR